MPPQLTPLPAPLPSLASGGSPHYEKITISVMFANGRYRSRCIALGITAEDQFTMAAAARKCAKYHFGKQPFTLTEIREGVFTAESGEPPQTNGVKS